MNDIEICRLCARCLSRAITQVGTKRMDGWWDIVAQKKYDPLHDDEQAAQVRWKLLDLGYKIEQDFDSLRILPPDRAWTARQLCLNTLDEYRLLAETLARHQKEEPKNG